MNKIIDFLLLVCSVGAAGSVLWLIIDLIRVFTTSKHFNYNSIFFFSGFLVTGAILVVVVVIVDSKKHKEMWNNRHKS